jgi:hypothetical protein
MAVTKLKQIDMPALLAMFEPEVWPKIEEAIKKFKPTHVVVFECLQMDSSSFGKRTALTIGGPENTYKTLGEVKDGRLGDVPSRFQYPTYYAEVTEGAR